MIQNIKKNITSIPLPVSLLNASHDTLVKGLILFSLTCQATSIALVTRYSKGILKQVYY